MDLNNRKLKIIHPAPSDETHPKTDAVGETVEETKELITI